MPAAKTAGCMQEWHACLEPGKPQDDLSGLIVDTLQALSSACHYSAPSQERIPSETTQRTCLAISVNGAHRMAMPAECAPAKHTHFAVCNQPSCPVVPTTPP